MQSYETHHFHPDIDFLEQDSNAGRDLFPSKSNRFFFALYLLRTLFQLISVCLVTAAIRDDSQDVNVIFAH
jgi:hypothetical protein